MREIDRVSEKPIHRHWLDHDFNKGRYQNLNRWVGRYLDNIFIERLWRSLKQEAVYLHEITDGFQANRIIDNWIGFTTPSARILLLKGARRTPHTSPERRYEMRHEHKRDGF